MKYILNNVKTLMYMYIDTSTIYYKNFSEKRLYLGFPRNLGKIEKSESGII